VLSTQKQRQRYYYFRNLISGISGVAAFASIGGVLGIPLGIVAAILAYFSLAPIIAFFICLFEQMAS